MPVAEYLRGIEAEWSRHSDSSLDLRTLYLGGGTPSKLGGAGVARLVDLVRSRTRLREDAEVTLEANPEDVTADALRQWRDAGVNRLSLGVQSFQDPVLAWMHRTHDAATARRAIAETRDAGIANVSIDLIFAMPRTVPRDWIRDLDAAVALDVPHISVYGLTVEPHTPLGKWVSGGSVTEAPEDGFAAEFMAAHAALTAAGYVHYEVSNYSKPGLHSRHNWAYWDRAAYVGLGPSAHEFDGFVRRWNVRHYADWMSRALGGSDTTEGEELLDADAVDAERVYLGLRTERGVDLAVTEQERIASWIESGWADINNAKLRLTAAGWLRLDALAADLTLVRSRY